jgi:hypothetical protein
MDSCGGHPGGRRRRAGGAGGVRSDFGGILQRRSFESWSVSRRAEPRGRLERDNLYATETPLRIAMPVRDRVVAVNGAAAVRSTMFVTVAADHRGIDGVIAARSLGSADEAPLLLLPRPEQEP